MGQVSLNEPVVGQQDSTEEPKIPANFVVLQTLLNGNLDSTNLSPTAGITKGQLAAGAGSLGVRNVTADTTAANGDLIIVTSGTPPVIVTLPPPTIHSIVGIVAFGATSTATTPSGVILGVGFNAASVTLATPGSFLILEANGTNWHTIGGQSDTGWVNLTLLGGVGTLAGCYTPAARLVGDHVRLRGVGVNNTGGSININTAFATLPVGTRPSSNLILPMVVESAGGAPGYSLDALVNSSNGQVTGFANNIPATARMSFDGLSYSLT